MQSIIKGILFPVLLGFFTVAVAEATKANEESEQDTTNCAASNIHLVFGGSFLYIKDDWADFKKPTIGDSVLFVQNDSRWRPAFITGLLLKRSDQWPDFLISLEFAQGTSRFLDGLLIGIGFRIAKQADLIFGYSRRLGKEPSPGFRREATHLVGVLQQDPEYAEWFSQYGDLSENENGELTLKQLDGFPLHDPRTKKRLYSGGDPIVDSFNGSFHVGIVVSGKGVKELFDPN